MIKFNKDNQDNEVFLHKNFITLCEEIHIYNEEELKLYCETLIKSKVVSYGFYNRLSYAIKLILNIPRCFKPSVLKNILVHEFDRHEDLEWINIYHKMNDLRFNILQRLIEMDISED